MESHTVSNEEGSWFQLPAEGYWKVTKGFGTTVECKLLNIDESRPIKKLEILRFQDEIFQHISSRVYKEDISLHEIVKEVLLKLEDLNNTLKEGRQT